MFHANHAGAVQVKLASDEYKYGIFTEKHRLREENKSKRRKKRESSDKNCDWISRKIKCTI